MKTENQGLFFADDGEVGIARCVAWSLSVLSKKSPNVDKCVKYIFRKTAQFCLIFWKYNSAGLSMSVRIMLLVMVKPCGGVDGDCSGGG